MSTLPVGNPAPLLHASWRGIRYPRTQHAYDPGMGKYYVYEHWQTQRAILHRAECSHCQQGLGLWRMRKQQYGKWHGEYDSIEEAMTADLWPRREIRACGLCLRQASHRGTRSRQPRAG